MSASGRTLIALLLWGYPLLFGVLGVMRSWPFVDDVPVPVTPLDDWEHYKSYALSILHSGLGIPAVDGLYGSQALAVVPRGFLYNYFLAGVFRVFGESSAPVYVVQSVLLGLSLTLFGLALRRRATEGAVLVFLVAAGVFAYLDFFRVLTFRLLSENLFLPLSAAFALALLSAAERRSVPSGVGAGLLLGGLVLTRPSAIGAAVATLLVLWVLEARRLPRTRSVPAIMTLAFVLTLSALPIRDAAMSGRVGFDILTDRGGLEAPTDRLALPEALGRRALFSLGFANAMVDEYRPRPQWLLPWLGLGVYFALRWVRRQRLRSWEMLWLAFLAGYLIPATFLGPVHGYGGRAVSIAVPFAIPFGAMWVDEFCRSWRARSG